MMRRGDWRTVPKVHWRPGRTHGCVTWQSRHGSLESGFWPEVRESCKNEYSALLPIWLCFGWWHIEVKDQTVTFWYAGRNAILHMMMMIMILMMMMTT